MKLSIGYKVLLASTGLVALFTAGLTQISSAAPVNLSPAPTAATSQLQLSTTQSGDFAEPTAGWTTPACVTSSSNTGANTAKKRNGGGDRKYIYPGQCTGHDVDSVYVYWVGQRENGKVCNTYLNGTKQNTRVWVNTAWWRSITIHVPCHR